MGKVNLSNISSLLHVPYFLTPSKVIELLLENYRKLNLIPLVKKKKKKTSCGINLPLLRHSQLKFFSILPQNQMPSYIYHSKRN